MRPTAADTRKQLLRAAATLLKGAGAVLAGTVTAQLQAPDRTSLIVHGEADTTDLEESDSSRSHASEAASVPPSPAHDDRLWLSPLEQAIVDALDDTFRTAAEIAARAQSPCSGTFRALLTNLVDRRIIESNVHRGYRIASLT